MTTAQGTGSALDFFPESTDLESLRAASKGCRGCDLWVRGTQTVFGDGPARARLMLVGEQPGDVEDEMGEPFVGPAGRMLDRCLADAGIERSGVYVTNVVKHFKWEARGRRRIHSKPNAREIRACRPWLDAEIADVRPEAVLLLGATAAQALLGRDFRVTLHRGEFVESDIAPLVMATVHPSSLLRAPDDETRRREIAAFTADLQRMRERLDG
jgi:DNA polymerase